MKNNSKSIKQIGAKGGGARGAKRGTSKGGGPPARAPPKKQQKIVAAPIEKTKEKAVKTSEIICPPNEEKAANLVINDVNMLHIYLN